LWLTLAENDAPLLTFAVPLAVLLLWPED